MAYAAGMAEHYMLIEGIGIGIGIAVVEFERFLVGSPSQLALVAEINADYLFPLLALYIIEIITPYKGRGHTVAHYVADKQLFPVDFAKGQEALESGGLTRSAREQNIESGFQVFRHLTENSVHVALDILRTAELVTLFLCHSLFMKDAEG